MKKVLFTIAAAAGLFLAASCSSPADKVLSGMEKITEELQDAKDADEVEEIMEKFTADMEVIEKDMGEDAVKELRNSEEFKKVAMDYMKALAEACERTGYSLF